MSGSGQPYKRCAGNGCRGGEAQRCGSPPRKQSDPIVTIKVQSGIRGDPPRFDFRVQSGECGRQDPAPRACGDRCRPTGCLCPVLAVAAGAALLLLLLL